MLDAGLLAMLLGVVGAGAAVVSALPAARPRASDPDAEGTEAGTDA